MFLLRVAFGLARVRLTSFDFKIEGSQEVDLLHVVVVAFFTRLFEKFTREKERDASRRIFIAFKERFQRGCLQALTSFGFALHNNIENWRNKHQCVVVERRRGAEGKV